MGPVCSPEEGATPDWRNDERGRIPEPSSAESAQNCWTGRKIAEGSRQSDPEEEGQETSQR